MEDQRKASLSAAELGACPTPFCASRDDIAPDFTTNAYYRGDEVEVSLKQFRGHWVILFFYSSDFTFV